MHWLGRLKNGQHHFKALTFQTRQPSSLRTSTQCSFSFRRTSSQSTSKYRSKATPSSKTHTLANTSFVVFLSASIVWYATIDTLKCDEQEPGPFITLSKGLDAQNGTSLHAAGTLRNPPDRKFRYTPLSPTEKTRLLILLPGNFKDDLQCLLEHVEVLENRDYVALSYFWGPPSGNTISCVGGTIPITHNLDAALRRLRHPKKTQHLWVDAICINQSDDEEKSEQVKIMRAIYTKARGVVVWLGPRSEQDYLAFKSLSRLKIFLEKETNLRLLLRLRWYRDEISGRVFSGGIHRIIMSERSRASTQKQGRGNFVLEDTEYDHLIRLLRRNWFRRTWVIQEAASAKTAIVLCGNESIPWRVLSEVYMRLGDDFLPVDQIGGQEAQHALENIDAIENARRSQNGPQSMPLFDILVATHSSTCGDLRDKIFGVVGLAKDGEDYPALTPDYTGGKEMVFETFKQFAIDHSKNPNLPSWAPNWTNIENAYPFVRYSGQTMFNASGDMAAIAWHSGDGQSLHVKGKIIDSIATLSPESKFSKAIAVFEIDQTKVKALQASWEWLQACEELAAKLHRGKATPARQEELWRTMTCSLTGEGFPAPQRYSDYFKNYMEFMKTAPEKFAEYLEESRTAPMGIQLEKDLPTIQHIESHAVIEASVVFEAACVLHQQPTAGMRT
jgi:hypothetical protein